MKTPVQMLIESVEYWNISIDCKNLFKQICVQALEIEKEHILQAWENGALPSFLGNYKYKSSDMYYKETYKKDTDETI